MSQPPYQQRKLVLPGNRHPYSLLTGSESIQPDSRRSHLVNPTGELQLGLPEQTFIPMRLPERGVRMFRGRRVDVAYLRAYDAAPSLPAASKVVARVTQNSLLSWKDIQHRNISSKRIHASSVFLRASALCWNQCGLIAAKTVSVAYVPKRNRLPFSRNVRTSPGATLPTKLKSPQIHEGIRRLSPCTFSLVNSLKATASSSRRGRKIL